MSDVDSVDGLLGVHVHDVRLRNDRSGCDFDWISGRNPGYGFSVGRAAGSVADGQTASIVAKTDDRWISDRIRSFFEQIDPKTGYIAD